MICLITCHLFLLEYAYNGTSLYYSDVIMGATASQITRFVIVYSTVYSGADQRKHKNSASLAFVWDIHLWPVNSPHKGPITRKMFPFDDVIMKKATSQGCGLGGVAKRENKHDSQWPCKQNLEIWMRLDWKRFQIIFLHFNKDGFLFRIKKYK